MKYTEILCCLALVWMVSSCASFEQYRLLYNEKLEQSDLEGAARIIEKKNFYQKDRNKVLYYLELGALARMQGQLEKSNEYLNKADYLIEDRRASLGAQGLAMVSNPRVLPYRTEYFENIAVHYLKSLNYLQLNDVSAARVEARRTNIRLQELNDAVPDKPLKYHDDVLGHITMGLSYEMNGEWNDAFIAYRNAAELFIEEGKVRPYMGVNMPEQLKCDLVRLARQIGFANEESYYSRLLNPSCENEDGPGGALALFWENGQGPIKEENMLGFNILRNSSSSELRFVNNRMGLEYDISPQDYNQYNGFTGINNISIALPAFRNRDFPLRSAKATYFGGTRQMEMIENLNQVAEQSLRDRFHRELAIALLRLAAKEALEASLRSIETKKKDSKEDEKEEQKEGEEKKKEEDKKEDKEKKKEDQYSDTAGQILGGAMDIINAITERADIRSWQSLPAEIFYQRIPLKKGLNEIKVTFYNQYNQRAEEHTLTLYGQGGLVVRNLITPGARVIQPTEKTIQP
ncbi:MAG: hypothetical protein H6557_14335 [Lewinellaceae bacterium]|nr:hypothetical protein [Phaeodactylibacter sp.]MCB9037789.1 hypothetical protein [Lewinellaceae bacterium]